MPKKDRHTAAARRPGKNPKRRTPGQGAVCGTKPGKEDAAPTAGNTLHSVRFSALQGTEVFFRREGIPDEGGVDKMYQDLLRVYKNAHYRIKRVRLKFDPASFMSLHRALSYILAEFGKLLPENFDFNIEIDKDGDYYFIVYRECESLWGWYHFPIKGLVKRLRKESPALHDLFLSFCRSLFTAGAELMTYGLMDNTLSHLDDRLYYHSEGDGDLSDEDAADMRSDLDNYRTGQAWQYTLTIAKAPLLSPEEILRRCQRIKRCAPIVALIAKGAKLLKEGNSLSQYDYFPTGREEFDGGFGVMLESQYTIVWDDSDSLYHEHAYLMDAYANEGVQEPVCYLPVTARAKKVDLADMKERLSWPLKLSEFFMEANNVIEKFTANEQQNRITIKAL